MSNQAPYLGSPRPAAIPAITILHPGLQVHSIAAPKTDRRLSFLMSANLYCAFAAGVVLVAQAAPTIHKPWITAAPPTVLVELRPAEATPRTIPPILPTLSNSLQPQTAAVPTIPEPQPIVDTDKTPTSIGVIDMSAQTAHNPTSTTGTGSVLGTTPNTGLVGDPPYNSQPLEVSASSVSVLRQVQPSYSSLARLAHKQGDVVLIMTINEHGVPTDVQMDSGDSIFRNDAIQAAQQWRFTPARLGGQPHAARFRLILQFRLRG